MENIIRKEIMGIVPKYIPNKGNCTMIYTKSEKIEIERSIKTVIKNMSNYYHYDLKESNNTYKNLLYTKKNPPIPFTKEDIFILVKTRKPIGKHDGAYGYIRIDAIERVIYRKGKDLNPRISFKNGESLEVLCTLDTLHKAIQNGEIVKRLFRDELSQGVKESSVPYLHRDRPASNEDIAMICFEIMKLANKG